MLLIQEQREEDIYEIRRNITEKRFYTVHRAVDSGPVGIYALYNGGRDICGPGSVRNSSDCGKYRYALYDDVIFHIYLICGRNFNSYSHTPGRKERKKGK